MIAEKFSKVRWRHTIKEKKMNSENKQMSTCRGSFGMPTPPSPTLMALTYFEIWPAQLGLLRSKVQPPIKTVNIASQSLLRSMGGLYFSF